LDFEGVLVPEIWINFAEYTGISELKATTRDVPDYDRLMRQRLKILKEHGFGLGDIQNVIEQMGPLPGAFEFLQWLRQQFQVIILSDTFYEFAAPLIKQFHWPVLLCHTLKCDDQGNVIDYILRQRDGKRQAVKAFKMLHYKVIAVGDSYNDTTMLSEADFGILFRPPENVIKEFPQFPVTREYSELKRVFQEAALKLENNRGGES